MRYLALLACTVTLTANAVDRVVFSCTAAGKPIIVHETKDGLRLTRPDGGPISTKTVAGKAVAFSGGGGAWLRLRAGNKAYVVYTGIGKWGPKGETREKEGLVVESDGYTVSATKCTSKAISSLGPDWFKSAGIAAKDETFDFPE